MSTFAKLPKRSSLTKALAPDNAIKTEDIAAANEKDVIRHPRILHEGAFSWSIPEERKEYKYITTSKQALRDLGLRENEDEDPEFQKIVSGEFYHDLSFRKTDFPFPYAQAYAGWQFGQFAGQLGDGRVHNLFEIPKSKDNVSPSTKYNRKEYEVQLKGSGKTPYSRFADGKAVIRSSIREYIISEHLNQIGIPTTRALSLTYLPETLAQRYSAERCAIVSRFAESWIRLGTFDLYRWRFDMDGIRKLSDYVVDELFTVEEGGKKVEFPFFEQTIESNPTFEKDIQKSLGKLTKYDKLYFETIVRNAMTASMWQCYGFLNGVLNTDNTSVLGLSMDFGPFSIMDKYDPEYTPNSEDHSGRYSYANTPTAIWWNLTRLGENLAQLIGAGTDLIDNPQFKANQFQNGWEDKIVKRASKVIEIGGEMYMYAFTKKYVETFFNRLGLSHKLIDTLDPEAQNADLISPMLDMLKSTQCDFNIFFVKLQEARVESADFDLDKFAASVLLQEVSEFDHYPRDELTQQVKEWVQKYQSYVSRTMEHDSFDRYERSSQYNPLFLPRNWILAEVIEQAEETKCADVSLLKKLEKMAFYPYDPSKWGDELKEYEDKWRLQSDAGEAETMLQCSCAS
ncbi:hypothetical protein CXQ85_001922 [Candidozyma haemuli]|uniref:Selenoprotein O n=1 Tax=Candidozyma haemuli TaxID=45357 RepID=A0A2V1AQX4_9ASCO|nr:hypothetical protein CXQ85_001922 [[Candida] haemuloni]PVH20142.1 hypothetical protein CXQ85_001922 [[Candida] haemuloni]